MRHGMLTVLLAVLCASGLLSGTDTCLSASLPAADTLAVTVAVAPSVSVRYTLVLDTLSVDTIRLTETARPSALADSLVEYAMGFLGRPYRYGGRGPSSFDCSGFARYVFQHFGYILEASSRAQFRSDRWAEVPSDSLRRGDLVFFGARGASGSVGHVGIVTDVEDGDFRFIHSATSTGITNTRYSVSPYYVKRYLGARRVLPDAPMPDAGLEETPSRYRGVDASVIEELTSPQQAQTSSPQSRMEVAQTVSAAEEPRPEPEVSSGASKPDPEPAQEPEYYTVVRGDSLYSIAKRHSVSLSSIFELNSIEPATRYRLMPGDVIRIR